MPPESFATLVNRKLLVPSSKTTYLAIEREFLIALLAPELSEIHLDDSWYLTQNPDVRDAIAKGTFTSASDHFCRVGYYENRMPYAIEVDEHWYLKSYPDIAAAVGQGAIASGHAHFYTEGYREGRFPHPNFKLAVRHNRPAARSKIPSKRSALPPAILERPPLTQAKWLK